MWKRLFSDEEYSSARNWLYSAAGWLLVAFTMAIILAIKFVYPTFLGEHPWLQMGRIRPIHVNTAAFGFLSMGLVGSIFYMIPRLTGVPLYSERLGNFTCWIWNLTMVLAVLTLATGHTEGREYAELIAPLDWLVLAGLIAIAYNVFGTIARRQEKQLYISLWYWMGTMIWFPLVFIIGNRTFVRLSGLNDAAVNWFYGHNVLGLWFTTLGVGVAYYLIPIISRNPLFSHKLSLIGFWTIAMVYAPTGAHHLLQAPIPEWLKSVAIVSSLLLLIPVAAAVTNFLATCKGKWDVVLSNIALRFTVTGVIWYLVTCVQGPLQASRPVNWYIHFSNWVVGHAHVALLGSFAYFVWGAFYHIIPRITGKDWYSRPLQEAHYWLTTLGFFFFFSALTIAGLQQAAMWRENVGFLKVVIAMKPMMVLRMLSGAAMVVGQYIFVYNLYRTVTARAEVPEEAVAVPARA